MVNVGGPGIDGMVNASGPDVDGVDVHRVHIGWVDAGRPLCLEAAQVGEAVGEASPQGGLHLVPAGQLGGEAEPLLQVFQLGERAAHQVVRPAAAAAEVLGQLGERPVLIEVEVAGIALVAGEHGPVDVEKSLQVGGAAKAGRRLRGGFWGRVRGLCQGQSLDSVREFGALRLSWAPPRPPIPPPGGASAPQGRRFQRGGGEPGGGG